MLKLKEQKLGLNNGIHTLIYAMTTCNDVVAIFTFGVILGVIFNPGKLSDQILQGPVGIIVGVVYGYVFGLILVYFPSKDSKYVNGLRFTMTVLGGCVSVMGSRAMGYPSAGALGCVTVTFVAGTLWRKQQKGNENPSVTNRLDLLWKFLKPVSFSLIGKEINFSVLDGRTVLYGLIVIAVGCMFRLGASYYSTNGANLTTKERCYITICGFPKATVQAALGPIALDMARQLNAGPDILSLASNILVISVIAIIFTAPLGAILMIQLAPRWLKHEGDGGTDARHRDAEGASELDRIPAQSPDNIAIITVGDNRILTDSAHSNNGFDHGNSGR
ncbi:sodium/hydrogen exchanger 9B2-like [Eupeodes corollae]|uniref:sodium/hydrogen exchanger 9B2-like n=1 Tax=Eupeodes corollae TaxID=290404 RepID=UPI002493CE6F|nr:sodium/hydrogen exchanger 9B2-like [Eupeodes corollae]